MHLLIGLLFAQDAAPGGGKAPPGGLFGDPSLVLMLGLMFAAFFFIVILPQRRREKKDREDLFGKLKKNDEVLTSSGIIGIVAFIKDDEVVLKVDESSNTRLRVLKSTILRVLNPKDGPGKTGADSKAAEGANTGG
jgi:preprotein translocase subunit YajC